MTHEPGCPQVFLVQETTTLDVSPSRKFGRITPLIGRLARPTDDEYRETYNTMNHRLRAATDRDWLLPNGDPVFIAMASQIFGRIVGQIRMLKWDRAHGEYRGVVVDIPQP
jgi:hypothetical protein